MGNYQCCDRNDDEHSEFNTPPSINVVNITEFKEDREKMKDIQDKQDQKDQEKPSEVHVEEEPAVETIVQGKPQNHQPIIPQLSSQIKKHLQNHQYFEEHFKFQPSIKSFGNQVYVGRLDQLTEKPQGYGKFYKSDGSLYIGHFHKGNAHGQGVYLFPNGSYYQGDFNHNHAHGLGHYWYQELQYEGHFKNNCFDGEGKQKGKNYEFQGNFYEGCKHYGKYKWRNQQNKQFQYNGYFNQRGQLHGKGVLIQQKGTYTGDFSNNLKHGKGVYNYKDGMKYDGQYREGVKSGQGILYRADSSIAYEGQWSSDMPHGIGYTYDPEKGKTQAKWEYGIDSVFL